MATKRKAKGGGKARKPGEAPRPAPPSAEVVRRILGPLDDAQVCRVLELGVDEAGLQQAAAALAGDLPGRIGRPIEGPAARVYDLMLAETWEEPERGARGAGAEP
ncbi:MAG: hypothetical protein ACKOGH_14990 [Alphaproteobacteria bacterium]